MKTILIALVMISFMLLTALVFVYLAWGIRKIFLLQFNPNYRINNSDAVIQKCGELLCTVYAPFVMLLLVAIFV